MKAFTWLRRATNRRLGRSSSKRTAASWSSRTDRSTATAAAASQTPPNDTRKRLEVAQTFFDYCNSHATSDKFKEIFSKDGQLKFSDFTMSIDSFAEENAPLYRGFPDVRFEMERLEDAGAGQVKIIGLVTIGTHTGPFAFGPYPEIPPTGKVVRNDPETLTFDIDDDYKIKTLTMIPNGELTGFSGLYEQVGGVIM